MFRREAKEEALKILKKEDGGGSRFQEMGGTQFRWRRWS